MKLMHLLKLIKLHHHNNVKAMETPTIRQVTIMMDHMAIHIKEMVQEEFSTTAKTEKKPLGS